MIKTAFNMLENETNVLTKTFEMTNIKLQAFVHPAQQFASTFNQWVQSKKCSLRSRIGAWKLRR